jgi:AcrR family transcriptional regulator
VADEGSPITRRKPRADAERNRLRLLEVAKAAFAERGPAASLDEIARTAGVGAGTLYRHFPTRDALIEAVYRNESEQLVAAAGRLSKAHDPVEALRQWMLLFVDYMATKNGMAEALNAIVGGVSDVRVTSGARVKQAIGELVGQAVASGAIRLQMEPLDLFRAVAAVPNGPAAKQLVDILIAGMRTER